MLIIFMICFDFFSVFGLFFIYFTINKIMLVELSSCLRCVYFNILGLPPSHSESESESDDEWI